MDGIREAEKELEMFEKIFLNKIQAKAAASAALHSPIHSTRSPSQRLLLKQATSSEDLTVQQTFANIESKSDASDNEEDNRDLDEEEEAEAGESDKFHVDSLASVPMVLEISSEARRREKHVITREGGRRYPHKRNSFYRRNMSAPNLSTMNAVRLGEKGSLFLEDDSSPSNEPAERSKRVTEEFLLLGGRVPLHQIANNTFAPSSSITAKKRSHSVMALMDFEKLVNDEKAAGKTLSFSLSAIAYSFPYRRSFLRVHHYDGKYQWQQQASNSPKWKRARRISAKWKTADENEERRKPCLEVFLSTNHCQCENGGGRGGK